TASGSSAAPSRTAAASAERASSVTGGGSSAAASTTSLWRGHSATSELRVSCSTEAGNGGGEYGCSHQESPASSARWTTASTSPSVYSRIRRATAGEGSRPVRTETSERTSSLPSAPSRIVSRARSLHRAADGPPGGLAAVRTEQHDALSRECRAEPSARRE